jgi:hypothetical protein
MRGLEPPMSCSQSRWPGRWPTSRVQDPKVPFGRSLRVAPFCGTGVPAIRDQAGNAPTALPAAAGALFELTGQPALDSPDAAGQVRVYSPGRRSLIEEFCSKHSSWREPDSNWRSRRYERREDDRTPLPR